MIISKYTNKEGTEHLKVLRDIIAMQAMQAILIGNTDSSNESIAKSAYEIADTMLKYRNNG